MARENARRLGVGAPRGMAAGRRARRCRGSASICWLPIRLTCAPATSPGSSPRCATSIRCGARRRARRLAIYRRLLPRGSELWFRNGWVVLEVGHDQAEAVAGLLADQRRESMVNESVYTGCRRKATLCCGENTKLSICPETPWILAQSAIGCALSGIVLRIQPADFVAKSGWMHGTMRSRLDCSQQGDVSSAPLTAQERH